MSHYYDAVTGEPRYTVKRTDGKGERDTNLRDARKLKLVPSVTTIIGTLAKPGLVNWQAEQTIYATLSSARQKEGEEYPDYVKRIIYEANNISRKTSNRGGELHNKLESFFNTHKIDQEDHDFIAPVIAKVLNLGLPGMTWIPEKSFASPLGFGGKVDLISDNPGQEFIIDFKTKNTTDKKKFYKYDEHLMQLAAYRHGLNLDKARCIDIYFSALESDIIEVHEWTEEDLLRGWKMFENLLNYWKLSNKM